MKPPEHHFVDEYGQREVKRMWLGSGIADRNGVEIFEGDILVDRDLEPFEVKFVDGQFVAAPYSHHGWLPLIDVADMLEINDHLSEDNHAENFRRLGTQRT